tara:strand:+ start:6281 stop:7492 length:1212 start_codon:yes stop_codon:yes gene_type:complete
LKERGIKIETPLVKEYIIGTGEHDTPYEVFGRALNNINNNVMNIKYTKGSLENLKLLENNKIDLCLCQEDLYYDNTFGNNKKYKNIRFLCGLYDELYFLIVPKDSPINLFGDLKNGFTINDSPFILGTSDENGGSLHILKQLCKYKNINLKKVEPNEQITNEDENILYYTSQPINTNFNLLINKKINAIFYISGPKLSYIVNISQIFPVKFIPFNYEEYKILNQIKIYNNTKRLIKIKENLIDSIETQDVETQGTRCVLLCNKRIDDTFIFNFLKSVYGNLDYLRNYMMNQNRSFGDIGILGTLNFNRDNNDWLETQDFNFSNTFLDSYGSKFKPLEMFYIDKNAKYHNGAIKYYKEIGYINNVESECKVNKDNMCNLLPYENKKNHYWKYEKIPGLQIRFSR